MFIYKKISASGFTNANLASVFEETSTDAYSFQKQPNEKKPIYKRLLMKLLM